MLPNLRGTLIETLWQLAEGKFDILSALVGAAVASLIAFVLYRLRDRITAMRDTTRSTAQTYQRRAMRGHNARYRDTVIGQANRWHIAGHAVELERVAIQPYFLPAPQPYNPITGEDGTDDGPYGNVPLVLDYPQVAGVYELPGIGVRHLLRDTPAIALLGAPGSGRSTALALIAIAASLQSRPDQPNGILPELVVPVLFHLADLNLTPDRLRGKVDPGVIVAEAARKRMRGRAANSTKDVVPPALLNGSGLLLVDGWDELPDFQRKQTLDWLHILVETYPGNRIVMAGPSKGYRPLVEAGLTPVYLRSWGDTEYQQLAQRWAEAWPTIAGSRRRPAPAPEEEQVWRAGQGNRSRMPLDVTLKIWASYAGDDPGTGRRGWYDAYVSRMLPAREGREALRRLAIELTKPGDMLGYPEEDVKAFVDAALARSAKLAMDTPDFLHEVTNSRPILSRRVENRLSFAHPLITGFLAADAVAASGRISDLYGAEAWLEVVVPFLSAVADVSHFVEEKLEANPEVLYDQLLALAAWTADAPEDAPWRQDLFRRLAQVLLTPSQFPTVRERALAALVASRNPDALVIFQQGLQAQDPLARRLAVLGLGALGDPNTVEDIAFAMDDPDYRVQVASALALSLISSDEALKLRVQLLFDGNEPVQRAVGESLAKDPETGHQLLRDAIADQDISIRRAAIYGLARVQDEWARAILEERQIEDAEWYVRDAAREAVVRIESDTVVDSPPPMPDPTRLPWLVQWIAKLEQVAAENDEKIEIVNEGLTMVIRALQEGDPELRYAAADALGKLGGVEAIPALYGALQDESGQVRDAAYRGLATISQAAGKPLPAVI